MRTLALVPFIAAVILAGEPEAPLNEARVAALVKKLSADDFKTRDAAYAELKRFGARAWPLLECSLHSEEKEVAARIRMLAADYEILLAEQREEVPKMIEKLHSDNYGDRVKGFDGLVQLGPGGIKILREKFSAEGAKPAATLEAPLTAVPYEQFQLKITITNNAENPFWIEAGSRGLSYDINFDQPFGEERLDVRTMSGGGARVLSCGRVRHPMGRYVALTKSSKPIEETFTRTTADRVGICKATASRSIPIQTKMSYNLFGQKDPLELVVNSAFSEEQKKLSASAKIFVLPNFDSPQQNSALALDVKAARDAELISATVLLTSDPNHRDPLKLEKDLSRYAWYVVLSENKPVRWGSWESVRASGVEREASVAERTLKAGESAEWKLNIPIEETFKDMTLIIGYEAQNTSPPADQFLTENEQDSQNSSFSGVVYARVPLK